MSDTLKHRETSVIPPSSLFVLWPGEHPPMAEEIRLRLLEWGQAAADDDAQVPEETLWSFWLELADRPQSCLVWCEPISGEHRVLLDKVRWRSPQQRTAAQQCRWMVGVEGALSLRHPTEDYRLQLQLCEAISRDWSPAVYDASSFEYRVPEEIRHLLGSKTPPGTRCLYTIHQVREESDDPAQELYWLHTHGLERAGLPDLELFDVPQNLVHAACELIDAVADLWIRYAIPDPQSPFSVGRNLMLAWRPWQAVVSEFDRSKAGGWDFRREEYGHSGDRAVLVHPYPAPSHQRKWRPPIEVLHQICGLDTTFYVSTDETERMSNLARERWGTFGLLFASHPSPDWRFAVKLSYPFPGESQRREHLWFEVCGLKPGRIEAKLVSEPVHVKNLTVGEVNWHEFRRLSDWRILTPEGIYDPSNADALLEERSYAG